jgi:hypothetical protein
VAATCWSSAGIPAALAWNSGHTAAKNRRSKMQGRCYTSLRATMACQLEWSAFSQTAALHKQQQCDMQQLDDLGT